MNQGYLGNRRNRTPERVFYTVLTRKKANDFWTSVDHYVISLSSLASPHIKDFQSLVIAEL